MADKTAAEAKQQAGRTFDMPTKYDPKQVEASWYGYWESHGLFRPDTALSVRAAHPEAGADGAGAAADAEPFTVVIPPPNVTGSLHLGHALNNTLQDALVRRRRMQGRLTLW
ncbi:MAG: class I tRNA ligase family protein, partial [Limnochordales bacterium]